MSIIERIRAFFTPAPAPEPPRAPLLAELFHFPLATRMDAIGSMVVDERGQMIIHFSPETHLEGQLAADRRAQAIANTMNAAWRDEREAGDDPKIY